ncbi:MAG: trypsin-like serine protease, partial [Bdellovibrionaceae bacterium]|nr:trypsin-like serine protease [Pseudobdellovibrionaceae bacterium]
MRSEKSISRAILSVLVGLSLAACAPAPSALQVVVEAPQIVNGEDVGENDFVSRATVAVVMARGGKLIGICTGALVAPRLVLTAAHCLEEKPERVIAVFAPETERVSLDRVRTVVDWKTHPDWGKNKKSGEGDLALVKLDSPAPADAEFAKILPSSVVLRENDEFVIAGYGISKPGNEDELSEGRGQLRKAKSKILGALSKNEVVSDGKTSSVCFGDSGGPAYFE